MNQPDQPRWPWPNRILTPWLLAWGLLVVGLLVYLAADSRETAHENKGEVREVKEQTKDVPNRNEVRQTVRESVREEVRETVKPEVRTAVREEAREAAKEGVAEAVSTTTTEPDEIPTTVDRPSTTEAPTPPTTAPRRPTTTQPPPTTTTTTAPCVYVGNSRLCRPA